MLAFDTNYLVRHLVQDDPRQCRVVAETMAAELEAGRTILLLDVVLCEVSWVLESCYGASRKDILKAFSALLEEPVFSFEDDARIQSALSSFEKGKADFSDYLIAGQCAATGCRLLTFDKRLSKEL